MSSRTFDFKNNIHNVIITEFDLPQRFIEEMNEEAEEELKRLNKNG